jgi:hypothetical protein
MPFRRPASLIVDSVRCTILSAVNRLTRQEQLVICIVCGLLLVGWAVKTYRTAHPVAVTTPNAGAAASESARN